MAEATKTDWVTPTAIAIGAAGVGAGLYFFLKKPPKEVKEGEWGEAGTILSRKTFSITVKPAAAGDWLPADTELARSAFSVTIAALAGPFLLYIASDPIYGGWVTTDPEKDVYYTGDIVVIEAHRFWPYVFDYWDIDNGAFFVTMNPMTLVITGHHVVVAHFRV